MFFTFCFLDPLITSYLHPNNKNKRTKILFETRYFGMFVPKIIFKKIILVNILYVPENLF